MGHATERSGTAAGLSNGRFHAGARAFAAFRRRGGTAGDKQGSFDKGIYLRFPLQLLGPETSARAAATVRPVQRDGGQRLAVGNPLWDVARDGRADALQRGFTGFVR